MVKVFEHPLITHKLTIMRNKETCTKDFRQNLDEISGLMAYEILRDLPVKEVEIETPICKTKTQSLACDVVLVPILRAGMGLVDGIRALVPTAKVGVIGLYRNEETLQPTEYFNKLPHDVTNSVCLVLDPMLATGGSAIEAVNIVKAKGAKNIKMVSLVGAPEGVKAFTSAHPDVDLYLAALDEKLNEKGYIVPGLGDAGDRIFGTK